LNLKNWTAANVLSHQDFLPNFRTYIALRLTDNGSGKTLTLSSAVFSSIWDANGNPQVLQDGLDQLRADIHNIVKTTKHWDVNKAN
jgi:predicted ATPase